MKQITKEELQLLLQSNSYPFSRKDLPEQVFSKKFDTFIFLEDVCFFTHDIFYQLKEFEKDIGGNYIYLHTVEPFLTEIEAYPNYYLKEIPPCFGFECSKNHTLEQIFDTNFSLNQSYNRAIRPIHILFGDSGQWGYYNSRDEQIGIIGLNKSVIENFRKDVPYVLQSCFESFDDMLTFTTQLIKEDKRLQVRDLLISNYSTVF